MTDILLSVLLGFYTMLAIITPDMLVIKKGCEHFIAKVLENY